jgi:ribosomal protein S18 acetylase RimI-like enzyme
MWVDPLYRRRGIGHALLDELLATARSTGLKGVQLDSPEFMTDAHRLYRSRGFERIDPYPESEIPEEYRAHWIFMEADLGSPSAAR